MWMFTAAALAEDVPEPLAERTLGLGVGTRFALTAPVGQLAVPVIDHAALRWQVTPKLALDPSIGVAWTGMGDVSATQLGLDLVARGYAASRGPVHLAGLAGLGFYDQAVEDDHAFGGQLSGGLGIEWTPSRALAFGLDTRSTLLAFDQGSGGADPAWTVSLSGPNVAADVFLFW